MKFIDDPIYQELLADQEWLIDQRRFFHTFPELSENEFGTQSKIMEILNTLSINHYPSAETGVCGVLLSENETLTIALRADIDALPIEEENPLPFRSQNPGVMHACGHDAHTTILLGVARYFAKRVEELPCHLKFFFQPAEETVGGADRMVQEGVMEDPKVDFTLGLHVMPYMPVGKIEIRNGKLNAASDSVKITVLGKSAHGAYPHQGVDAIAIAAQVLTAIQTFITRFISPLDQVVLTIGQIHGGVKNNIICDEVVMSGGMRTTDENTRTFIKERLTELVTGIATSYGGSASVSFTEGYKALINDDEVVAVIREVAVKALDRENVIEKEHPSLGVEDFSYFLDKSKGAFYHLGCGFENGPLGALHTKDFIMDETALTLGVYLQVKAIYALVDKFLSKGIDKTIND